jgi:hypothetical protein
MIAAVCPTDPEHKEFITTAHVMEDWVVDEHGSWLSTMESIQTDHGPDPDNTWYCRTCGADAIVTVT